MDNMMRRPFERLLRKILNYPRFFLARHWFKHSDVHAIVKIWSSSAFMAIPWFWCWSFWEHQQNERLIRVTIGKL
jgi:hypothetical protein